MGICLMIYKRSLTISISTRWCLIQKKCVFDVSLGKLLGYIVSARGIDANTKKVEVIEQLQPPWTRREIHKLAGMMAALSQFISKLGEHSLPFYNLLCKADGFWWGLVSGVQPHRDSKGPRRGPQWLGPTSRTFQKTMTCSPRHRKLYL
jgi:hypothetical protein